MGSQVFTTPGSTTFDVPKSITSITVKVWSAGAGGGAGGTASVGGAGGGGGYVGGTISVTAEETLSIHVGGAGGSGAFGGTYSGAGGGGGGKSSIFRSTTPLFIAGAGGGGGGGDNSSATAGGAGGGGGGSTGVAGSSSSSAGGGGGGTQSDGGAGGTGGNQDGLDGNSPSESPDGAGGDGASGVGTGGGGSGGTTNGGDGGIGDDTDGFAGGGGGGAGYSGGGGGSSSASGDAGGGGGGGGSNYIDSGATDTTNSQASGITPPNTGDPDYTEGIGVGGAGGTTSTAGNDGNGGKIVIIWSSTSFSGGMQFVAASSQYLESISSFTPLPDVTVCFWLYLNTTSNTQRIMGCDGFYEVGLNNGRLFNDLYQASTGNFQAVEVFGAKTWYHVTCTRDSSNYALIYINGAQDNTSSINSLVPSSDNLRIGHRIGASEDDYLNGSVEDMRIYNRVLGADEVQTIYGSNGSDGIVYNLEHRWIFDEGGEGVIASGTGIIKDLTPNGLNMTPNNNPVYGGTKLKFNRFF